MWFDKCSFYDIVSLFENEAYVQRLYEKFLRKRRLVQTNRKARRGLHKDKPKKPIGWGERKRDLNAGVDEVRRLREY